VGIVDGEADQEHAAGVNLGTARLSDFYSADDVLAEIGRGTMAAARKLALIISAKEPGYTLAAEEVFISLAPSRRLARSAVERYASVTTRSAFKSCQRPATTRTGQVRPGPVHGLSACT
jgi:hypothetical protein